MNHFLAEDPATGRRVIEDAPFISLSCGTVDRDAVRRTNVIHRARRTALQFGTRFGELDTAYLFICWVVVATQVKGVEKWTRDAPGEAFRQESWYPNPAFVAPETLSNVRDYL